MNLPAFRDHAASLANGVSLLSRLRDRFAARLDAGGYYGWLARALLPPGERVEPAPPPEENDAEELASGAEAAGGQASAA